MKVFVIFGCPGSGKSTLSKLLNSDLVLEADSFQKLDYFDEQDWKQSRLALRDKLQECLKLESFKIIIIDDDLLLLSQRKAILHICQQYKTSYIEIYFDVPLEQLLYRNQQRVAKKQLNPEILTMIHSKFESKSLKNTIKLKEVFSLQELNLQIDQLLLKEDYKYQESDKIQQIQQNSTNKIHQTDLEIRKIIAQLCKETNNKKYDPKYLSNKKKEFLKQDLHEDIQLNVIQFLKNL